MQSTVRTNYGQGLSWFLIAYLLMLLSVLMLVHVLQPQRDGPGSSSRSPVHQERRKAAKQAVAVPPAGQEVGGRDRSASSATYHDILYDIGASPEWPPPLARAQALGADAACRSRPDGALPMALC